jgi:hypothetical protein
MAAVAKAEAAQQGQVGVAELRQRIDKTINHELWPVIRAIDEGFREGDDAGEAGDAGGQRTNIIS